MEKKVTGSLEKIQLRTGYGRRILEPVKRTAVKGKELLCLAESEEEAEKTAEQYGIELVSFRNGVAVFHTEDDPVKVIQYGISQKWTRLSLNTADTTIK